MSEQRVTPQQKKAVAERANGCCEYCRSQARLTKSDRTSFTVNKQRAIALPLPLTNKERSHHLQ